MFKPNYNQRSQQYTQYRSHYHQHQHQHQHNQSNQKTSICKYAKIGCKQRETCWYAHNKDELKYRYCSNGATCNKQDCPFVHGDILPDKDVYYLRIILNSNIIGIDNSLIVKELNILANREIKQKKTETYDKFIIELDNEDEEESENEDDTDEILEELSNLDIGKWGDYEEDKIDEVDENKNDLELKNYIDEVTKKWSDKETREQFYDIQEEVEIKKDVNMMVHVSDNEFEEILKYLNSMNIEYVKL